MIGLGLKRVRYKPVRLEKSITVRMTLCSFNQVNILARLLKCSRGDAIRQAIDYTYNHSGKAREQGKK